MEKEQGKQARDSPPPCLPNPVRAMREVALGEIARVTTSFPFRRKIEADPKGGVFVVQGKDIRPDRSLDAAGLTPIRLPVGARVDGKLIEMDDILMMCRGEFPYATHVPEPLPPAVAQNSFSVLRLHDPEATLPAYLALVLNQSLVQKRIRRRIKGTKIPYLGIEQLRDLPVPMQPLRRQAGLLALHRSMRREHRLHRDLESARRNLLDGLLVQD